MSSHRPETGPDEPIPPFQQPSGWQALRRGALRQLRRFGSPTCLLLGLVLFPLPWVEIQCSGRAKSVPASGPPGAVTEAHWTTFLTKHGVGDEIAERLVPWEQKTETLFTQSGFQAARGTFTPQLKPNDSEAMRQLTDLVTWSPYMALFPIVLVIGAAAGLVMAEPHRWRGKLVVGSVLAALILLLVQSLVGFPLETAFAEVLRRQAVEAKQSAPAGGPVYRTRYAIPLWLTLASLGAALSPFVADWYLRRRE